VKSVTNTNSSDLARNDDRFAAGLACPNDCVDAALEVSCDRPKAAVTELLGTIGPDCPECGRRFDVLRGFVAEDHDAEDRDFAGDGDSRDFETGGSVA
jgi:hypothetical protein